jgi:Zn-finger nucleic acid-binding protein
MEIDELNIILLELKYCERCGGLWLRTRDSEEVLCASCSAQMANRHTAPRGKHNLRLALTTTLRADGENREVVVLCGEGGNA